MFEGDLPRIEDDKIRKARKQHVCCECQEVINPGEKYHWFKGLWDMGWQEYQTCLKCEELRRSIPREWYQPDGIEFGKLHEALKYIQEGG